MSFQRLNTRSAKIHGEGVMEIRRRYARMESYPVIRQAIIEMFGIQLSIQQITRIAKGESFAQLPQLPTDREVDLTMAVNALGHGQGHGQVNAAAVPVSPPNEGDVAASIAKLHAQLAQEAARPSVHEILADRARMMHAHEHAHDDEIEARVPTLEEIEARERAILGVEPGAGLEKLKAVSRPALNAEKLLETLKDDDQNRSQETGETGLDSGRESGDNNS